MQVSDLQTFTPRDLQKTDRNYVYMHVDPTTGEVVYVGLGVGSRAWDIRTRDVNQNHYVWLQSQLETGFIPTDWVVVEFRNLSRLEAQERELELIHQLGPKFNVSGSWAAKKYSLDDVKNWKVLRETGLTYKEIGMKTGVGEMVIYRALSGQTAAYRSALNVK